MIRPEPVRAAVLERRIRPLSRSLALRMLDRCCQPGLRRITAEVVPDAPSTLAALLQRAFVVHCVRFGLDNALLAAGEGRFS